MEATVNPTIANPYIANLVLQLSPEQRGWFEYESRRSRKEPALAFALDLVLGLFGAHDFYLGDTTRGVLMLIGTMSGIGTLITFPVWFISLFTIFRDTEAYNDAVDYWLLAWAFAGTQMPPAPPPQRGRCAPIGGLPAVVPVRRQQGA
jgi:TM2 domain-containing membrane protein YozV